jgi:hypothetical protein
MELIIILYWIIIIYNICYNSNNNDTLSNNFDSNFTGFNVNYENVSNSELLYLYNCAGIKQNFIPNPEICFISYNTKKQNHYF